jgi:hypothetical protein
MADHPIDNEIERLEEELKLKKLEKKLVESKDKNDGVAPAKLKLEVREARREFRTKYRDRVAVQPEAVGAGSSVSAATGKGN